MIPLKQILKPRQMNRACTWLLLALLASSSSLVANADPPTYTMPAGTSSEVINAFNDASRAIQSGRTEFAAEKFKYVCATLPQFGPAHTGYGVALAKMGRNAEALAEFEKANSIMPGDEQTLAQLIQMSALSGRNNDALDYYKKYQSLHPNGKHAQMLKMSMGNLQRETKAAGNTSSTGQDNYLNEVLAHYRNRLHVNSAKWMQMPITVYLPGGIGIDGYRPEFQAILGESFTAWSNATQGRVAIKFVDNPAEAVIKCKWTANPNDLQTPQEGGHALLGLTQQGVLKQVDVVILTKDLQRPGNPLSENTLRFICLHEVGHALGIAGHSSQPGDVMFYGVNADVGVAPALSERDKKTMTMLYSR